MKICVISSGMQQKNIRLQPWRYFQDFCQQSIRLGEQVVVISDGSPGLPATDAIDGVPVRRLRHINYPPIQGNASLQSAIAEKNPDVLLWHLGLTSALHLDMRRLGGRLAIAVFTSPIYHVRDILTLGGKEIWTDFGDIYLHLIGSLLPSFFIRRLLRKNVFSAIIVLSHSVKQGLVKHGIASDRIHVIPPGINEEWLKADISSETIQRIRGELGFSSQNFVISYFGSPRTIRGVDTLAKAIALACRQDRNIRLLILSRRRTDELTLEEKSFRNLIDKLKIDRYVNIVSGFLSQKDVICYVASSDVVTLPFKLIPSDMPLSILEAMALGKPAISTNIGCIPEILSHDYGMLVHVNNERQLARTFLELACNQEQRERMGGNARISMKTYPTRVEVAKKILAVIKNYSRTRG